MTRQELVAKARELSRSIFKSEEYQEYLFARNEAYGNGTTRALVDRYHRLQLKVQGQMLSGDKGDDATTAMEELQKLGELLQFDVAASRLLMAEYTLHALMGEVYSALGAELDMDIPSLEEEEAQEAKARETIEEEGEAQKEEEQGND